MRWRGLVALRWPRWRALVDLGWGGDPTSDEPSAGVLDSGPLQLAAGGSGSREVCIGRDVDQPRRLEAAGPPRCRDGGPRNQGVLTVPSSVPGVFSGVRWDAPGRGVARRQGPSPRQRRCRFGPCVWCRCRCGTAMRSRWSRNTGPAATNSSPDMVEGVQPQPADAALTAPQPPPVPRSRRCHSAVQTTPIGIVM
jgi:hypothetical protein